VAAAAQATPTPTPTATPEATPTPAPTPPPPSECATPVEIMPTGEPTPSVDGMCRVSAAVCSILGTDGDDVLTGSPFDDIICGFGGNDRIDGGDGNDVLFGGEGDDELVGGAGNDCLIGGPGDDAADSFEFPETESLPGLDTVDGYIVWGVTFDAEGRCTNTLDSPEGGVLGQEVSSRPVAVGVAPSGSALTGAATVAGGASTPGPGGVRIGLAGGQLAVRNDVVRVPVSCSAVAPAELVLLAGSQRIGHKRFTCTPPGSTARVRLNDAGRRLVARDERVQARLLMLAGGRTVSRQVLLISSGG